MSFAHRTAIGVERDFVRYDRPCNPGVFVSESAGSYVRMSACRNGPDPICEWPCFLGNAEHVKAGAKDEQCSNGFLPPFADAKQIDSSAGAVLTRCQADRCCEIATTGELLAVAQGTREGARSDRTYTGNR
jgi:hypothetical protein